MSRSISKSIGQPVIDTHLKRPEVDLHVHTVASGHAYSTIEEITRAAAAKGVRGVGMSDHGPAMHGAPHEYHFMALRFMPEWLNGVRVFKGVEANILAGGRVDLGDNFLRDLDVVLAGFHVDCGYTGTTAAQNTKAMLQVMENPLVNIISHPGNPAFPIDYEAVVKQALATGTALEINSSSLGNARCGSKPHCMEIARLCAEHGTQIAIGSDAHISVTVGEVAAAVELALAAGVRWEQVVNRTLESTLKFLNIEGDVNI
ncbi:MAG: phosphatase [Desulfuromonas sp.]|nr:phosphatase [Desulfuromonas sp.]